jgi:hypothetical protein
MDTGFLCGDRDSREMKAFSAMCDGSPKAFPDGAKLLGAGTLQIKRADSEIRRQLPARRSDEVFQTRARWSRLIACVHRRDASARSMRRDGCGDYTINGKRGCVYGDRRVGAISRCGDEMMRAMLYEAAQAMLLRSAQWSWLKASAMQIARRRGMKRAIVALARRLAVILQRIWVDGTEFRWTREAAAA